MIDCPVCDSPRTGPKKTCPKCQWPTSGGWGKCPHCAKEFLGGQRKQHHGRCRQDFIRRTAERVEFTKFSDKSLTLRDENYNKMKIANESDRMAEAVATIEQILDHARRKAAIR